MPNIRQASGPHAQPLPQDGQQSQQPVVSNLPGLAPLAQNKMQFGLMPREQKAQVSSLRPNSLVHNQYSSSSQLLTQAGVQLPQLTQNQAVEQGTLPGYTGTQNPVATPFYSKQQVQPPLLQQEGQAGAANLGHHSQLIAPNANLQTSLLTRPPISNQNFQVQTSLLLLAYVMQDGQT